jgi:hypothetical protein
VLSIPFIDGEVNSSRHLATSQTPDRHYIHFAGSIALTLIMSPLSVPITFTFCPANSSGFFWSLIRHLQAIVAEKKKSRDRRCGAGV